MVGGGNFYLFPLALLLNLALHYNIIYFLCWFTFLNGYWIISSTPTMSIVFIVMSYICCIFDAIMWVFL